MLLILMTNEDSNIISSDIINDNVYMTDPLYVERIFSQSKLDNILITNNYVEQVGRIKIKRFVEMLYLLEPYAYVMVCDPNGDLPFIDSNSAAILPTKIEMLNMDKVNALIQRRATGQNTTGKKFNEASELKALTAKARILSSTGKDEGLRNFLYESSDIILDALDGRTELEKQLKIERDENERLFNKVASLSQNTQESKITYLKQSLERVKEDRNKLYSTAVDYLSTVESIRDAKMKRYANIDSRKLAVIYFKELEDIEFHRIFESMFRRFNSQRIFVKALILDENENSHRIYKGDYVKVKDSMKVNDLLDTDKTVRFGNGVNIIQELCNPLYGLQVLMVLDRRAGSDIPINTSDNLLPMYLVRNQENIDLDIPYHNMISPNSGEYENIDKIADDSSIDIWVSRTNLFRYINRFVTKIGMK